MQTQDVRLTIMVNRELKENAETLFDYLGLNMSNAINIFLRKTVDQRGIPFPVNPDCQGFAELGVEEVTIDAYDKIFIYDNSITPSILFKKDNRVVRKLQFLNNFLIKIAFLQGFSLKKCWTCEGTNRVPEQVK